MGVSVLHEHQPQLDPGVHVPQPEPVVVPIMLGLGPDNPWELQVPGTLQIYPPDLLLPGQEGPLHHKSPRRVRFVCTAGTFFSVCTAESFVRNESESGE